MLFVYTIEEAVRKAGFFDKFTSVLLVNNACSENFQSRNM